MWIRLVASFSNGDWWLVFVAFLLLFVNWGLEGYKWKRLMENEYSISLAVAVKAAFAGNATGAFTPNRIGGFVGRVLYLPKEQVLTGTLNTFVGNLAQFLATIIFGVVSAVAIQWIPISIGTFSNFGFEPWVPALVFIFIGFIFLHIYFFAEAWLNVLFRFKAMKNWKERFQFLARHSKQLLAEVLLLSLLRYLVFAIQFYLILLFFTVEIDFLICIALIGYLYLVITLVPTLLGKLGVREGVACVIFSTFSPSVLVTTMSSLLLWMLNVAIASLIGGVLVLFIKKKK